MVNMNDCDLVETIKRMTFGNISMKN